MTFEKHRSPGIERRLGGAIMALIAASLAWPGSAQDLAASEPGAVQDAERSPVPESHFGEDEPCLPAAGPEAVEEPNAESPAMSFEEAFADFEADNQPGVEQCAPPPPVRPPAPDIFGFFAVPLGSPNVSRKWIASRSVSLDETRGRWSELVDQAGKPGDPDPLVLVNRWVNRHVRYVDDAYGDEWAPAFVTLTRGWGDCEDLAIAKMELLKAIGIPQDDMFVVLLREKYRRIEHAILSVRRNDRMYVLDSRTDRILPAEQVDDYLPTFSFTGSFGWIYGSAANRLDR